MTSIHGICPLVFIEKPIPASFFKGEFSGVPICKGESH
jgi:hypothetical protein